MFNFLSRVAEVQNGMNTSAFARQIGMNQKTIDLYMKGERKPSVDFVLNICSTFKVSADWLLGLSEERGKTATVVDASHNTGSIAIGGGNAVSRDCLECPLLQAHLKRFSTPKKSR